MFLFQNKFWLNLHRFLRGEVYRRRSNLQLGVDPASLDQPYLEGRPFETAVHDLIRDAR